MPELLEPKPFNSFEEELAHHKQRGETLFWQNVELQEKLEEYERVSANIEQLVKDRVEIGFELLVALQKEEDELFFERANCAWGETELVLGKMLTGTPDMDNFHRLALFNYDGVFVQFWQPAPDDIFAEDWRIADLERNKAWKAKLDAMKRQSVLNRSNESACCDCVYDEEKDNSELHEFTAEEIENMTE